MRLTAWQHAYRVTAGARGDCLARTSSPSSAFCVLLRRASLYYRSVSRAFIDWTLHRTVCPSDSYHQTTTTTPRRSGGHSNYRRRGLPTNLLEHSCYAEDITRRDVCSRNATTIPRKGPWNAFLFFHHYLIRLQTVQRPSHLSSVQHCVTA